MDNFTEAMAIPPSSSERIVFQQFGNISSTPSSSSGCGSGDDSCDAKHFPLNLTLRDQQILLDKNSTVDALEEAIRRCKELVLDAEQCSEERKWLVRHLIELRLRLQERQDADEDPEHPLNSPNLELTRIHLGHHFKPQPSKISSSSKIYCDQCACVIWNLLQTWYICEDCGFFSHHKCVNNIIRICAIIRAAEKPGYELNICPELGLHQQNYHCAECNSAITLSYSWSEARLCDYDGKYYCPRCHWNASVSIPARAIHNWDLARRRICQACAQTLRLQMQRPLIPLAKINPRLFSLVHELSVVQKQRDQIIQIKRYLVLCRKATERHLLSALSNRPHMAEGSVGIPENSDETETETHGSQLYSMQDLIDIDSGALPQFLQEVMNIFIKHIKTDCEVCYGRGHLCELCGNSEVIFPFDDCAVNCDKCSAVFHRACWVRKNQICSRCLRREKRNMIEKEQSESSEEK